MQSKAQHKPISASASTQHRVATLDVLRGLALVGILAVNMEYYSQTVYDGWFQPEFRGWGDMTVRWFVTAFFQLKAYLVFAFLFGYNFGMFGQPGPVACLLIAVAVSIIFVLISILWFKRCRFGPVEWLLRSVNYWRGQPFVKQMKRSSSTF